MPMTWTPEANAQLLLGILDQIKDQGLKINNAKLAEYMGPECSIRAVDQQVQKLKKQAGSGLSDSSVAGSAGAGAGANTGAGDRGGSAAGPPTKTPTKRRAAGSKTGTPRKRGKKQATAGGENGTAANGDGDGIGVSAGGDNGDAAGGSQAVDGNVAGEVGDRDEEV